jgi:hypothetical protein
MAGSAVVAWAMRGVVAARPQGSFYVRFPELRQAGT